MIGFRLRLQQLGAAQFALGVKLADFVFLGIRQAGRHWAAGDENRRQMAEGERADQQAGDDLVAYPEIDGGIEGRVREGDGGRKRDDVAGKQGQLHAGLALGDAVAHRRHAAGDHRHAAGFMRGGADEVGVTFIGLVGGEHVVIGGDDGEAGAVAGAQHRLVARGAGGKPMRLVGAAQSPAMRFGIHRRGDAGEIGGARSAATAGDAGGYVLNARIEHGSLLQAIGPRRQKISDSGLKKSITCVRPGAYSKLPVDADVHRFAVAEDHQAVIGLRE